MSSSDARLCVFTWASSLSAVRQVVLIRIDTPYFPGFELARPINIIVLIKNVDITSKKEFWLNSAGIVLQRHC